MAAPQETYVNSVQRRGYSDARLQPADFGAAGETLGRAVTGFGQDLGTVATNLNEIQKQDAETAAQEADNMRLAQRMKYFYDGDEGLFNKQGKDAMIAAQQAPQDLKVIDDGVANKLLKGNAWALKMYNDATAKRNSDDLPRIWQHEHTQRIEHEKAVDAAAFDLAIDNASSSEDPKVIEENIATVGNIAVKQLLRTKEYDPNLITQTRQTAVGKAVAAVAQKLELKSPSEAQAFVTTHAGMMDPQDAASLLDSLAPAAAKEGADSEVKSWIVTTSPAQQLNAPTTTTSPMGANAAPTPIPPDAALDAAQFTGPGAQEGATAHTDARGNLIRSPKGAAGITQVMPATGVDPGHGVKPLQNNSRAEYLRFGRDYRNALLKKYDGNITLALTAYNWGEGNVDAQIKKVGDPRKGQISDASFVNSIPVKEARDYAPSILSKVGVNVAGSASPEQAQAPTYAGGEINLQATIDRINASDQPYVKKQALIEAATRMHSLDRQSQAEADERLTDAAFTEVNQLGDGFTDYNKLPLSIRQQLAASPRLEAQFKGMAESNLKSVQAAADKAKADQADKTIEDLTELAYANPDAFSKIDFRAQYPELDHTQRMSMMGQQQQYLKSHTEGKGPDYGAMRTMFTRYAGPAVAKDPKRMGFNFQEALRQEQTILSEPGRNGKPLTDVEREGIVRRVLMPVVIHTTDGGKVVTRAEAPSTARALGGSFRGADANLREQARDAFQIRTGRIPSDYELDLAVQQWKATHPTGYRYGGR